MWLRSCSLLTCRESSQTAGSITPPTANTANVPTPWRSSFTSNSRRAASSTSEAEGPEDEGPGKVHQFLKRQGTYSRKHRIFFYKVLYKSLGSSEKIRFKATYLAANIPGKNTNSRINTIKHYAKAFPNLYSRHPSKYIVQCSGSASQ